MSRREDISNAIWSDEEFVELSAEAKLVYLWSFTNPRCGMAGMYRVMSRAAQLETGLSADAFAGAIDELGRRRFVFYDGRVLWVRSRVKHLRTRGEKIAAAIQRDLEAIGSHELVEHFSAEYDDIDWVWKTSRTPSRNPSMGDGTPIDDPSMTHREPIEGSPGRAGQGSSSSSSSSSSSEDARENESSTPITRAKNAGFQEWLTDHAAVTGETVPKANTRIYAHLAEMFNGRISDGLSLEDLKLATRGAFGDEFRNANGHYGAESVLRPTKTLKLVNNGRRLASRSNGMSEDVRRKLLG